VLLAPLLIASTLPGCPPGECVGAGCEDVYSAAMISVFQGEPDGLGTRVDPFEDAWFSMTGSEAMGPDWSVDLTMGTLVIGAPELGAVLVFQLDGREVGAIGGQALVVPHVVDSQPGGRLGSALLRHDIDGDGRRELLVTAPSGDGVDDAVAAGRLYLFDSSGHFSRPLFDSAEPPQLSTDDAGLAILGAQPYDQTGSELAACGDIDGDGLGELAIAARWDDSAGEPLGGAVTVISSAAVAALLDSGQQSAPLSSVGVSYALAQPGGSAGAALNCSRNLDDDDLPELLVGAPFADAEHEAGGAVFIVRGQQILEDLGDQASAELEASASAVIHGPADEAYFGSSLDLGDVDGNGKPDLLVGAPGAARGRGQALLYADIEPTRTDPPITLVFKGESGGDHFGAAVALADLNGDGFQDIIAGAPRHNPSGDAEHFAAGAAYVWYGDAFLRAWDRRSSAGKAETTIERKQAWLLTGGHIATGDLDGDGLDELVLVHRILPDF
jgi:hypothetical protein